GIRVPAILRWPGQLKEGMKSDQVMTALDVFPTLAAAAGVTPRNKLPFDGKNLWPAIAKGKAEPREPLFFAVEAGPRLFLAVRYQGWKLVRDDGTNYLFRIDEDPDERTDVSAQHPDKVKDLAERIEKWRALYPARGIHATDRPPPGWKG